MLEFAGAKRYRFRRTKMCPIDDAQADERSAALASKLNRIFDGSATELSTTNSNQHRGKHWRLPENATTNLMGNPPGRTHPSPRTRRSKRGLCPYISLP